MKPKIEIDITDHYGKYSELISGSFEPYEVYINGERIGASEKVEELEDENAKLRELVGATTHCRDCKHFTPNDEIWAEPPLVPITMIMGTCDTCDFWANTKCKVEPDGSCAWGEPRIEVNDD